MGEGGSPFEQQVLWQARRVLGAAGYEMRLATFRVGDSILPALRDLTCDGLIVLPGPRREVLLELNRVRPSATPTVVLDRIPEGLDLNAVATDNSYGGALAAKHLIDLGHRHLAMVLAEPDVDARAARVAGFTYHAELAGVASVEVIDCLAMAERRGTPISDGTFGVAHTGIAQLLSERGRLGFTGIFADSDMGAIGIMKALHQALIAMPQDLSVIDFDDLPIVRFYHSSLTTISQDLGGWISAALAMIEARLGGHVGSAQHVRVRPELVVRESTGVVPPTIAPGSTP